MSEQRALRRSERLRSGERSRSVEANRSSSVDTLHSVDDVGAETETSQRRRRSAAVATTGTGRRASISTATPTTPAPTAAATPTTSRPKRRSTSGAVATGGGGGGGNDSETSQQRSLRGNPPGRTEKESSAESNESFASSISSTASRRYRRLTALVMEPQIEIIPEEGEPNESGAANEAEQPQSVAYHTRSRGAGQELLKELVATPRKRGSRRTSQSSEQLGEKEIAPEMKKKKKKNYPSCFCCRSSGDRTHHVTKQQSPGIVNVQKDEAQNSGISKTSPCIPSRIGKKISPCILPTIPEGRLPGRNQQSISQSHNQGQSIPLETISSDTNTNKSTAQFSSSTDPEPENFINDHHFTIEIHEEEVQKSVENLLEEICGRVEESSSASDRSRKDDTVELLPEDQKVSNVGGTVELLPENQKLLDDKCCVILPPSLDEVIEKLQSTSSVGGSSSSSSPLPSSSSSSSTSTSKPQLDEKATKSATKSDANAIKGQAEIATSGHRTPSIQQSPQKDTSPVKIKQDVAKAKFSPTKAKPLEDGDGSENLSKKSEGSDLHETSSITEMVPDFGETKKTVPNFDDTISMERIIIEKSPVRKAANDGQNQIPKKETKELGVVGELDKPLQQTDSTELQNAGKESSKPEPDSASIVSSPKIASPSNRKSQTPAKVPESSPPIVSGNLSNETIRSPQRSSQTPISNIDDNDIKKRKRSKRLSDPKISTSGKDAAESSDASPEFSPSLMLKKGRKSVETKKIRESESVHESTQPDDTKTESSSSKAQQITLKQSPEKSKIPETDIGKKSGKDAESFECWPDIENVEAIWANRKKPKFLVNNLIGAYSFLTNLGECDVDLPNELFTGDDDDLETIWQQLATRNKKLLKRFNKYRSLFEVEVPRSKLEKASTDKDVVKPVEKIQFDGEEDEEEDYEDDGDAGEDEVMVDGDDGDNEEEDEDEEMEDGHEEQADLFNLKDEDLELKDLEKELNEMEQEEQGEDEHQEAAANERSEENENETETEKAGRKFRKTVVDDRFFSLAQMEEFLEQEERRDTSKGFFDALIEEEKDAEESTAADYHYSDFFDAIPGEDSNGVGVDQTKKTKKKKKKAKQDATVESEENDEEETIVKEKEKIKKTQKKKEKKKHVRFADDDGDDDAEHNDDDEEGDQEGKEENDDDDDGHHDRNERVLLGAVEEERVNESEFEKRQKKIKSRIAAMEEANLAPQKWQMIGEISAVERDENALLEQHVAFDHSAKTAPIITVDSTAKLEALIIQRIKDKAFDDVVQQVREPETESKYRAPVDEPMVKKSLAEVYEEQFQKTNQAEPSEEKQNEKVEEIDKMMKELFKKLDALSHFKYIPPEIQPEVRVVSNIASLQKEEVGPMASTDDVLMAPEEVKRHEKGEMKSKDERDETDRARERRKKKKMQRLKNVDKRPHDNADIDSGEINGEPKKKKKKKHSKLSAEAATVTSSGNAKSTSFFKELQQTVQNELKEKTKKLSQNQKTERIPKRNASAKYKL